MPDLRSLAFLQTFAVGFDDFLVAHKSLFTPYTIQFLLLYCNILFWKLEITCQRNTIA